MATTNFPSPEEVISELESLNTGDMDRLELAIQTIKVNTMVQEIMKVWQTTLSSDKPIYLTRGELENWYQLSSEVLIGCIKMSDALDQTLVARITEAGAGVSETIIPAQASKMKHPLDECIV